MRTDSLLWFYLLRFTLAFSAVLKIFRLQFHATTKDEVAVNYSITIA